MIQKVNKKYDTTEETISICMFNWPQNWTYLPDQTSVFIRCFIPDKEDK